MRHFLALFPGVFALSPLYRLCWNRSTVFVWVVGSCLAVSGYDVLVGIDV